MDLNQKIIAVLVGGFLLIALLRVFRTPLRLSASTSTTDLPSCASVRMAFMASHVLPSAARLLVNTLLGFAALWAIRATAGITGVTLGLNLCNALVVGILGVPGLVLLLLVQWVL